MHTLLSIYVIAICMVSSSPQTRRLLAGDRWATEEVDQCKNNGNLPIQSVKKDMKMVYSTRATEMVLDSKIKPNTDLWTKLQDINLKTHYKVQPKVIDPVARKLNKRRFYVQGNYKECLETFWSFIKFNEYGILHGQHRKYNYAITQIEQKAKTPKKNSLISGIFKKKNKKEEVSKPEPSSSSYRFRFMHAGEANDKSIKDQRAKHIVLNGDKGSVKMAGEFYFHTSEYEGKQHVFLLIDLCSGTFRPSKDKLDVYKQLLSTIFGFDKEEQVLNKHEMLVKDDKNKVLLTMTKLWHSEHDNVGIKIITGDRMKDGKITGEPACVADHLTHFHLTYEH